MLRDKKLQLNGEWSLFLDRDGVINKRPMNDYVKQWSQFHFIEGVLEARLPSRCGNARLGIWVLIVVMVSPLAMTLLM